MHIHVLHCAVLLYAVGLHPSPASMPCSTQTPGVRRGFSTKSLVGWESIHWRWLCIILKPQPKSSFKKMQHPSLWQTFQTGNCYTITCLTSSFITTGAMFITHCTCDCAIAPSHQLASDKARLRLNTQPLLLWLCLLQMVISNECICIVHTHCNCD